VSREPLSQLAWFLLLYVVLLAPFFFAGWGARHAADRREEAVHAPPLTSS
jgi:hypothetical protein